MPLDASHLQDRLVDLVDRHRVVGASLAVALGDEEVVAAAGVLNRRTDQPATPDSVFQIGSITKVWTATLAMQLVDEGLLDVDASVVSYLPEFKADPELTVRHLLTHTSGLAGDFFPDTGRGEDCLQRYLAELSGLPASHPLGATLSYCNAGFTVLGRLVEVLREDTWDRVLRAHLLEPLGLLSAGTLPEEALLWGAATGHVTPAGAGQAEVAPVWGLPRCVGPAGLIHSRARDLLTFARLHLSDGLAPDGTRLLSATAARAMREPQVEIPDRWTFGGHWGLGWILTSWSGRPVYGHDGGTIGQNAFLRVLPGVEGGPALTISLLTNGGQMRELYQDLFDEVAGLYAGVALPPRLAPPVDPPIFDAARYVGEYVRESMSYRVEAGPDGLRMVSTPTGALVAAMGAEQVSEPLVPFAPDTFLTQMPGVSGWMPAVFYALADGSDYLHMGGRATPRVS